MPWTSGKPLSTGASLRRKRGLKSRKNKARQRNQDHGSGRSPWSSRCRLHRKCYTTRGDVGYVDLGPNGDPGSPAERNWRDNAYDSDRLDAGLRSYGIELIAPHRSTRKNKTQDRRRLRRYRRRWKVERLFAWLQNFRRLVVRYERYAENFLGMLYLACCLILLRYCRVEDERRC